MDTDHGPVEPEVTRTIQQKREMLALKVEAAALLDRSLRLEHRLSVARRRTRVINRLRGLLSRSGEEDMDDGRSIERCAAVLLKSGLFDSDYYLRRNLDVAAGGEEPVLHYLRCGAAERRDPGPYFSTTWYLEQNPDVAKSGVNPLYHYVIHGQTERRLPLPAGKSFAEEVVRDAGLAPAFGAVSVTSPLARDAGLAAKNASASGGRMVVYTAVFGDYDDLFVPSLEQVSHCDFVAFTDQPSVPSPWRRGRVDYVNPDNARRNRFHKLLPHRLFPEYEWSLYLDANIELRSDPIAFLNRYRDLGPAFFLFSHPARRTVAEELGACLTKRKDDPLLMMRQVSRYLESGFRNSFPLTENNVLLRRHNDPALAALNEAWWEEVKSNSGRDQLSLPFVLERAGYRDVALFGNEISVRNSPDFVIRPHRMLTLS
jgi:hypothetical protein